MQRQPVESTSIYSAGYDPATSTLEVEFRNHRIYRYIGVPPEVYEALLTAESVGRYFAYNIRNDYECWRLVHRAGAKHKTSGE